MLTNVLIFGEMCVLSLIYISAAVYRFCALSCVFFFFASVCHFLIIQFMFLLFLLYLFFVFYFVYSMFLYCFMLFYIVLYIVSPFMLSLSYFVQDYRPLPPGGNPTAGNT